jgi:hypothetical protein
MKNWMAQVWCKKMHRGAMWPIHGKYICPQCLREYPVVWDGGQPTAATLHLVKPLAAPRAVMASRVALVPQSDPMVASSTR